MKKQEKVIKIKTYNTIPQTKEKYWPTFVKLIEDQFQFGGTTKYKLSGFEDREATDVISAVFGGPNEDQWILGTILKYLFRWNNLHREKDILKMVTYLYLLWIKQGYHMNQEHDTDTKK